MTTPDPGKDGPLPWGHKWTKARAQHGLRNPTQCLIPRGGIVEGPHCLGSPSGDASWDFLLALGMKLALYRFAVVWVLFAGLKLDLGPLTRWQVLQ